MSIGATPHGESELALLCKLALERREVSSLIGASTTIVEADLSKSDLSTSLFYAETLVEAAYFTAARDLLTALARRSPNHDFSALVSRVARRSRRPLDIAYERPLIEATNLWILGKPKSALSKIEIALLKAPDDFDSNLTKALILSDLGYIDDAMKLCILIRNLDLFGLAKIELLALQIQIEMDLGFAITETLRDFRAEVTIPGLPQEGEQLCDILELSIRLRMDDSHRPQELIERLNNHPLGIAFAPLFGAIPQVPLNSSLRRRIIFLLAKATRVSKSDRVRLVQEALQLAETEELVAPFLELRNQLNTSILEVAGTTSTRFQERLVNLLVRPSGQRRKSLTDRELLIMRLFEAGSTTQEIANDLHVSCETVKSHSHHVLQKLKVATRSEALVHLRELGLLA